MFFSPSELQILIPEGLTITFALHVLDFFEHYRFKAVIAELEVEKKKIWDGFFLLEVKWLKNAISHGGKIDIAHYMAGSR